MSYKGPRWAAVATLVVLAAAAAPLLLRASYEFPASTPTNEATWCALATTRIAFLYVAASAMMSTLHQVAIWPSDRTPERVLQRFSSVEKLCFTARDHVLTFYMYLQGGDPAYEAAAAQHDGHPCDEAAGQLPIPTTTAPSPALPGGQETTAGMCAMLPAFLGTRSICCCVSVGCMCS